MSAEEGDDGEHTAMIVLRFREPELPKDVVDVLLDRGLGHHEQAGDTGVGPVSYTHLTLPTILRV